MKSIEAVPLDILPFGMITMEKRITLVEI